MFYEGGIVNKKTSWNSNPQIFQRWRDGQTGLPLVDANMREIAQTGLHPLQTRRTPCAL